MHYRKLGTTEAEVSELGFGAWGIGGKQWQGADDDTSLRALRRAFELGVNLVDTALAYGDGHSEQLVGRAVQGCYQKVYVATKIPPKNRIWPASPSTPISEVFPYDHIIQCTEESLRNLKCEQIYLQQFHVWTDAWAHTEEWQRAIEILRRSGKVRYFGISITEHEPDSALEAIKIGAITAVQVIYNIFDQAPQDELFPLCRELQVGVIARVPFDEGTLTGTLTKQSRWPEGDWRNTYFVPENLSASVDRAGALRPLVPEGMTMAELALRWILTEPTVSTVIPGMRKTKHVEANLAVSDGRPLDPELVERLKAHRWDRTPTSWSQ